MKNFDAFSKGPSEAYRPPVKLIKPSSGKIVELEMIEEDVAGIYMKSLKTYAETFEQFGAHWEINGKTLRLTFTEEATAQILRRIWEKL